MEQGNLVDLPQNYIDVLEKDTGLDPISIRTAMHDRGVWKAIVDWGHYPP